MGDCKEGNKQKSLRMLVFLALVTLLCTFGFLFLAGCFVRLEEIGIGICGKERAFRIRPVSLHHHPLPAGNLKIFLL